MAVVWKPEKRWLPELDSQRPAMGWLLSRNTIQEGYSVWNGVVSYRSRLGQSWALRMMGTARTAATTAKRTPLQKRPEREAPRMPPTKVTT